MDLTRGNIVRSVAGHDKGTLYCVLSAQEERLLLVNGKQKKLNAPKQKGRRHVAFAGNSNHPAIEKLQRGESVTDSELRRAIAAFRDRLAETEEV